MRLRNWLRCAVVLLLLTSGSAVMLADNAPAPALHDQIVARNHSAVCACKHHQNLHHARFQCLDCVTGTEFEQRRPHQNVAKPKISLTRETLRPNRLEQGWPLVHGAIIGFAGKSSGAHRFELRNKRLQHRRAPARAETADRSNKAPWASSTQSPPAPTRAGRILRQGFPHRNAGGCA